jgi:hypothetical protein
LQPRCRILKLAAGVALAALACSQPAAESAPPAAKSQAEPAQPGDAPPTAKLDTAQMLKDDLAAQRHPSDGGGRAWLEPSQEAVTAGQPARFRLGFEVGPLGIATGGGIYLQVSPFWGWSTPQTRDRQAPGYTAIETSASDIELKPRTLAPQLLLLKVTGRPLVAGDRVTLIYGAGSARAVADRFAERGSRFWFAVDGDGDGVRQVLKDSPQVEVLPGPPAQLQVTLPGTARPGEQVPVTLALLDATGNAGTPAAAEIVFPERTAGLELPARVALAPADRGRKTIFAAAREPGIVRLRAEGPEGLSAESNPMLIASEGPRVLWGDLHGHSNFSDGTGTPEDYYLYARDVSGLDIAALTDHDHWGMLFLDAHPEMWDEIQRQTRRFYEPGRFVTLLGYEWTSWIQGHRHVLHFEDQARLLSSLDPSYESPVQLWRALAGKPALTFAHHSAGGPIATNWAIPPDPVLEPVTEIVSAHGSSEASDSPQPIYNPVEGNYVRDALGRGYRFGFIGSGDSHDGHPGLAQLSAPSGGLAAILAEERTRESVLAALRARRVYASNGPRILLRTALGAHPMGSSIPVPPGGSVSESLFVSVTSPGPLERVDLIRSGRVVDSMQLAGERDVQLEREVSDLRPGEYVYVRAVQRDGGAAWSSPIYID